MSMDPEPEREPGTENPGIPNLALVCYFFLDIM